MRISCQPYARWKTTLSLGASLAALAIPGIAAAQTAPQEDTMAERASTDQDEGDTVIIVTAQGRQQSLADVPVAVSAVSSDLLEKAGTSDIRELNSLAPSLLVSSTGNEANGSARIRGVGTVGDNPGLESSVPVFIDGVYRSRSGNALSELGPVDRIEILRGPQGTLGGRNSTAGLISIYTAPPEFDLSGYGNFTYGNYDTYRVEAGINVPLSTSIAGRVDGVYLKRDGFYHDVVNDTDVNNKDRWLVRGQLLFEPNADLSVRLIADYSKKDEACCAATFVQPDFAPLARVSPGLDPFARPTGGPALTSTANPIIPVLLSLGQDPRALSQSTFNRDIYVTPGRSYEGQTEDYGFSGEINYDFGGAKLTSITAYRDYSNYQGSDTDYTQVDILYRAPNEFGGARAFKTFSQELRLQGTAFDDKLDWLVGGYFANEDLEVKDNLRFGTQYGAFASCRLLATISPALPRSAASPGCLVPDNPLLPGGTAGLLRGIFPDPDGAGPIVGGQAFIDGLTALSSISDRGSTGEIYNQNSKNYALFTHNIFHVTDKFDITVGLRYTHEKKDFDATFSNDNTVCPAVKAQLLPYLTGAQQTTVPAALIGGIISLSCQGNSTSQLDGVSLSDSISENKFTGTGILSYKVTPDLLAYASYARGYKAGGFNLDRSALGNPIFLNPAAIDTNNLKFAAETVNAYEAGLKYAKGGFSASLTAFRQEFSNFQLNTFNGSVFLVQNINGCDTDLNGGDRDGSAATGSCSADDVTAGVVSQGFELETSISPARYLTTTLGLTYADTSYEDNLVGSDSGAPLDPALRLLPGDNLSNAPEYIVTSSLSYTPPLGNSGWSGLFFVNARMVSDYNTGSDLLYGKEQDGFVVVNGRIGVRTPDERFSIEGWVSNLFDIGYTQVAFNTPFTAPQQVYSAYLAEPRTYGITLRGKF